jgi:hypothetical protein
MARERGRGHLVRRAAHVERAASEMARIERLLQRGFIHQIAARALMKSTQFHPCKRLRVHQVPFRFGGERAARRNRLREQSGRSS